MRRYKDHEMVLKAIQDVRNELIKMDNNSVSPETSATLMRLSSLYACLDVMELRQMVRDLRGLDRRGVSSDMRSKKVA